MQEDRLRVMVKEVCFTLAPTGLMNNPMILFPLGKPQR